MAYGNWGAWVYRNDENMPDWQDAIPYREQQGVSGFPAVLIAGRADSLGAHHAVLGQQRVRLCGYKYWPVLFLDGQEYNLDPFRRMEQAEENIAGELLGYRFAAVLDPVEENRIDLYLREPDGTVWVSRCGYGYGAGYDDEPVNEAWPDGLPEVTA